MNIDTLAAELEAAKIAEESAKSARIDAETALVALLGAKDEGAQTHRGNAYKVTVTGVVNRTVDEGALDAVRERVSPEIFAKAFRYKPAVNDSGIRYLRDNEPELYAIVATAITAKPGKPSVRVECVGEQREAA